MKTFVFVGQKLQLSNFSIILSRSDNLFIQFQQIAPEYVLTNKVKKKECLIRQL